MKVKLIEDIRLLKLEESVNDFIGDNKTKEIISIQYQTSPLGNQGGILYSCLIQYRNRLKINKVEHSNL